MISTHGATGINDGTWNNHQQQQFTPSGGTAVVRRLTASPSCTSIHHQLMGWMTMEERYNRAAVVAVLTRVSFHTHSWIAAAPRRILITRDHQHRQCERRLPMASGHSALTCRRRKRSRSRRLSKRHADYSACGIRSNEPTTRDWHQFR